MITNARPPPPTFMLRKYFTKENSISNSYSRKKI